MLASFLLGGPSGTGVATTVTIGSVAYPMLERAGYGKDAAGGLLAAGGLGAIISPPVLGAAAFLIAEFLKISYLDVLLMAVIPTGLYYLSLFLMVELDARKFGMRAVALERAESPWAPDAALLVSLPLAGLDRRLHGHGLLADAVGLLGDRGHVPREPPPARERDGLLTTSSAAGGRSSGSSCRAKLVQALEDGSSACSTSPRPAPPPGSSSAWSP